MKTKLMNFAGALLICIGTAFPLAAQNAASPGGDTNNSAGYLESAVKHNAGIDRDLERMRMDNEKDIEKTRLDNEKSMVNNKSDNHRLIVHDLAWNSWVLFVIAIFFFGYLRDRRRHETIRLMIEKGTPLTPELLDGLRKKSRMTVRTAYDPHGYLCWGVTLVAVGLGLLFVSRPAAAIVGAVGVANLILWGIDRVNSPKNDQPK